MITIQIELKTFVNRRCDIAMAKKSASICVYGTMLLGCVSLAAAAQTNDARGPDSSHSTPAVTGAASSWLKTLDLMIEAETVEGGMIVRRGYIAESELDLSMLPALHLPNCAELSPTIA